MSTSNIHFAYEPPKPDKPASILGKKFAQALIDKFGQNEFKNADTVVAIGGDGTLLHAFNNAVKGQQFFGITPPQSDSKGFWLNHGVETAEQLKHALGAAQGFQINPLKATITFADNQTRTLRAFGEVAFSRNSAQAALMNLRLHFPTTVSEPIRIMGDGIDFSTPYGSTGLNKTYFGSTADIRIPLIQMTGMGIYQPADFPSTIATNDTKFEIDFLSPQKRPIRIDYDGKSISSDMTNPIQKLAIEKDKDFSVELLLTEDPATRAFAAIL